MRCIEISIQKSTRYETERETETEREKAKGTVNEREGKESTNKSSFMVNYFHIPQRNETIYFDCHAKCQAEQQ